MALTASDVLVDTLLAWDVHVVFGIPGDGVNGVIEAFRKRQEQIRFIQTRHEEAAAFMACAYAKWTGKLGVCISTSGPGGVHLLNGLYDAKFDGVPVLAITGLQYHDLIGTFTQQDIELDKLFQDVCVYNQRVMGAAHMENVAELACRTATARHSVAHLTIPIDVQEQALRSDARSVRNRPHHVSNVKACSAIVPNEEELDEAARILNEGNKVVILAGAGALGAGEELASVAELLGAPVAKALLGKAVLPDDHPHVTGGVGLLGTMPSQDALSECDTLLIAGSGFPYIEFYPQPGKARCVQIDRDPQRISLRYPAEVGLVGNMRSVLRALLPRLRRKSDRAFLEKIKSGIAEWNEFQKRLGTRTDTPMKADVVAYELNNLLQPGAIITTDCGTNTFYASRHLIIRDGMQFTTSGTLATMACGLPYANAAKIAYPDRQVIALVGDGGVAMLLSELATAVKYNLDIKVVVLSNHTFGQIKWEQMIFMGNPEYVCDLQPIDFATVARGFGMKGYRIEDPATCGEILREAVAQPGPALIDCVVDKNEPPLPPKITSQQGLHLVEALVRGEEYRSEIIKKTLGIVRELV
jgi:pyruvate dehydrogenase (quinone)